MAEESGSGNVRGRLTVRKVLASVGSPGHVGLAYVAWAPVGDDGKVPDNERSNWLTALANIAIDHDYPSYFARWKATFNAPGDHVFELSLASRLLVGHGNSSATDVGLTLHYPWGVPVIPGSALKGLLAHYVDSTYGPEDPTLVPWEQPDAERERAAYQGVIWRGRRIVRGPGDVYRALFGAPDAEEDEVMRARGFDAGASAGLVTFHDALYVPGSVPDDKPFAADVLTVHHKGYYDSGGRGSPPNDYESPTPVAFLTVRPGARMLFALSGPADWTELAGQLLRDALDEWGVGGKTSAGYGHLVAREHYPTIHTRSVAATPPGDTASPKVGDCVEVTLLAERTKKGGWKARHEPSGLEGPIQNSDQVPPNKNSGDRITAIVRVAKGPKSQFAVSAESTPDGAGRKGSR